MTSKLIHASICSGFVADPTEGEAMKLKERALTTYQLTFDYLRPKENYQFSNISYFL